MFVGKQIGEGVLRSKRSQPGLHLRKHRHAMDGVAVRLSNIGRGEG